MHLHSSPTLEPETLIVTSAVCPDLLSLHVCQKAVTFRKELPKSARAVDVNDSLSSWAYENCRLRLPRRRRRLLYHYHHYVASSSTTTTSTMTKESTHPINPIAEFGRPLNLMESYPAVYHHTIVGPFSCIANNRIVIIVYSTISIIGEYSTLQFLIVCYSVRLRFRGVDFRNRLGSNSPVASRSAARGVRTADPRNVALILRLLLLCCIVRVEGFLLLNVS